MGYVFAQFDSLPLPVGVLERDSALLAIHRENPRGRDGSIDHRNRRFGPMVTRGSTLSVLCLPSSNKRVILRFSKSIFSTVAVVFVTSTASMPLPEVMSCVDAGCGCARTNTREIIHSAFHRFILPSPPDRILGRARGQHAVLRRWSGIARGRCLGYWQKCQMEDRSARLAKSPLQLTTITCPASQSGLFLLGRVIVQFFCMLPLSFKADDGPLLSQSYSEPTG